MSRYSTRIITCLLLSLLLLGSCGQAGGKSDPIASVSAEKTPLRLEEGVLRPLIFEGETSSTRYSLEEGKITAVANGFSLDLYFSDTLDPASIESAIQLKGPSEVQYIAKQQESAPAGGQHIVNINVPAAPPGNYQLTITNALAGKNSLPLGESIPISIHLEAQTEGEFFLLDSSGLPRPITYEECRNGLALSDTAKTFIIHFDQEVNQVSVEDSLKSGLKEQPVITAFSWLTPQQLRVNLTQLQTGMSYHLILDQGMDKKGNSILGSCYFRTGKASNVGVIQLATGEMNMLYQFSEERFSGVRSQLINNKILLQAGTSLTWSFGLGARQLFSLPSLRYDLALPQHYREPIWLDYDNLLGYDSSSKTLNLVSAPEGKVTPLYTLPDRPIECRLSPNGRLLAVTCKNTADSQKVDLLLIDIRKKTLLHQLAAFAQPYNTPTGLPTINLTWSSNDAIIYADGNHILRAYLSSEGKIMEKTNTIVKDGRILDYYGDESLLLYRPVGGNSDSLYLLQDDKSRRLKNISAEEKNFYCVLVNPETILYQKGEEIYRYSIAGQSSELIGGGLLLGVSANRDKAYYMVNAEDYSRSAP